VTAHVVVLALIVSAFTAMASVAQRWAAASTPEKFSFNIHLVGYLFRRPVWFAGIASMILGFVFQILALRSGNLSVVQPVIATELVIVFGVIAIHDPRRVHLRDWISAVGMVVGLGAFLAARSPEWWPPARVCIDVAVGRYRHVRVCLIAERCRVLSGPRCPSGQWGTQSGISGDGRRRWVWFCLPR
jgi:hypothetical protein